MYIFIFALLSPLFIADKLVLRGKKPLFSVKEINVLLDSSNSVNAYVIGKNLIVTKGFLNNLSRDEQKAILAHELSHIVLNHYNKTKIFLISSIILSLILFQINIVFSLFTLIIVFLFSKYLGRRQEIEADKLAYRVVGEELKSVIEKYGDREGSIFSSHPTAYTRLKMLSF